MNNKPFQYFTYCATSYFRPFHCPFCGSSGGQVSDRKYLVARLIRCDRCALHFRHPQDSVEQNKKFYQDEYIETDITRNLPDDEKLAGWKKANFAGSGKDYRTKIDFIEALVGRMDRAVRIIDYGASWGYTSWQFRAAGFDVQSLEISEPMAKFASTKLGLDIQTSPDALQAGADVFFSAHVIEHLPDLRSFFDIARKLISPNGYFVCYSPNASDAFRKRKPQTFRSHWGLVHPLLPSAEFYAHVFQAVPYLITTEGDDERVALQWDSETQSIGKVDGDELLVVAKLNSPFIVRRCGKVTPSSCNVKHESIQQPFTS